MHDLTPFDDREVARTSLAITRAGDGLSEALKVAPREFHHGDTVYVVLECTCTRVQFVPFDRDDPSGPLTRVHTLAAGTATIVDEELVRSHISEQAERNLRAREEEAGIIRMFEMTPRQLLRWGVGVAAIGNVIVALQPSYAAVVAGFVGAPVALHRAQRIRRRLH